MDDEFCIVKKDATLMMREIIHHGLLETQADVDAVCNALQYFSRTTGVRITPHNGATLVLLCAVYVSGVRRDRTHNNRAFALVSGVPATTLDAIECTFRAAVNHYIPLKVSQTNPFS